MTIQLSSYAGGGLNQSQVDARVVAVTSGLQRWVLRPGVELGTLPVAPTVATNQAMATFWGVPTTYTFSASADNNISWTVPMPKRWDLGAFRFRFRWRPSNTSTGVVRWRTLPMLTPVGDLEAFSDSLGTAQIVDDAGGGTASRLQVTGWTPSLSFSGAAEGDLVGFIFQRQAGSAPSDTFTGTAQLISIEAEWTSNAPTDD